MLETFYAQISHVPLTNWIFMVLFAAGTVFLPAIIRPVFKKIERPHNRFFIDFLRGLILPARAALALTALLLLAAGLSIHVKDQIWYQKAYVVAMVALFAWTGRLGILMLCDFILQRFDVGVKDNLAARRIHTQIRVLRRLGSAIIFIVALAAALMVFDQIRALGVSLIASAGVAGIILGLAAQKTIGNFFTGLQIAITQPIRIDDAVVVEGEWGWIEEINLTYIVIRIWDLRRLVLPINYFVEKPFQNWTRTSARIIGTVMLHVDYATPIQPLRDELDRVLDGNPLWDGQVKVVQVTDTTDRSMAVRVLVSAGDSPSAWDLRCQVREHMIGFLARNYPECLPRLRAEIGETAPASEEEAAA